MKTTHTLTFLIATLALSSFPFIHGCTPGGTTSYKTLTVNVTGSGTTTPSKSTSWPFGTTAKIHAMPATGWKFDHWEGAISGSTNPVSIKMTTDIAITAVFVTGSTHNAPVAYNLTVTSPKNTPVSFNLAGYSPDGNPLTFVPQGIPSHGNISFASPVMTYIPSVGYTGPDGFEYKVSDTYGSSQAAKVNITVPDTGLSGWTHSFGSSGDDAVNSVNIDTHGNVLVAGKFSDNVDFNPGAPNELHASGGKTDAFVSKFDANGQLLWTRTFGGSENDLATAVTTDGSDNVYVVGIFSKTMIVDLDSETTLSCQETTAGFICKFDSTGKFVWAKAITGDTNAGANCAAADASGNLYVGGGFTGKAAFDDDKPSDDTSSHGQIDGFLASYNSAGELDWVRVYGGLMDDEVTAVGIEVGGSIFVAGTFSSNADLSGDAADSHGSTDIFLMKVNGSGNRLWSKIIGGNGTDRVYGLSPDTTGNFVAICGSFEQTVNFRPSGVIDNHTSQGGPDAFVSYYNTAGNYQWTRTFGGSGKDLCKDVTFDTGGNMYVVGAFTGTVDFSKSFGTVTTHKKTSAGELDAFVTQILPAGGYSYTSTVGGTGDDIGNCILQNKSSLVTYWGGSFQNTANLSPDENHDEDHTSFGLDDCFLIDMNPDGTW